MHVHKARRNISSTEVDHSTSLGRNKAVVNRDNPTAFYGYCLLLEEITLLGIEKESRVYHGGRQGRLGAEDC